jgi:hypothetical protein
VETGMTKSQTNQMRAVSLVKGIGQGSAPWVVLLLIGIGMLVGHWGDQLQKERRKNLLQMNLAGGQHVGARRYDVTTGEDVLSSLPSIPNSQTRPLVILSGMSQMYAINDAKPGDETISEIMDDQLAPHGIRIFGLAAPNLCNEEALLLLLTTVAKPETTPCIFMYGVCFDKFRNISLRPGYQDLLRARPDIQRLWLQVAAEYIAKYPEASSEMMASLQSTRGEGTQKAGSVVEERIRDMAGKVSPVVRYRQELNGQLQMEAFLFRNWLFNIKPSTKRPLLESRYELNKEFLHILTDTARAHGVGVVYYVIPLNPIAENPYIPSQYKEFKEWIASMCEREHVPFANLEDIVPTQDWGEFMGGPDYKHFKEAGHRITAMTLLQVFRGPLETCKAQGDPR